MFSFIFMNVACFQTQTKITNEVLSDVCDRSTLFYVYLKPFSMKEY